MSSASNWNIAGLAVPLAVVALPVAAAYAQGRVSHYGVFSALEDEMCRFGTDSFTGSPDRVDALVWGGSTLLRPSTLAPRIRMI